LKAPYGCMEADGLARRHAKIVCSKFHCLKRALERAGAQGKHRARTEGGVVVPQAKQFRRAWVLVPRHPFGGSVWWTEASASQTRAWGGRGRGAMAGVVHAPNWVVRVRVSLWRTCSPVGPPRRVAVVCGATGGGPQGGGGGSRGSPLRGGGGRGSPKRKTWFQEMMEEGVDGEGDDSDFPFLPPVMGKESQGGGAAAKGGGGSKKSSSKGTFPLLAKTVKVKGKEVAVDTLSAEEQQFYLRKAEKRALRSKRNARDAVMGAFSKGKAKGRNKGKLTGMEWGVEQQEMMEAYWVGRGMWRPRSRRALVREGKFHLVYRSPELMDTRLLKLGESLPPGADLVQMGNVYAKVFTMDPAGCRRTLKALREVLPDLDDGDVAVMLTKCPGILKHACADKDEEAGGGVVSVPGEDGQAGVPSTEVQVDVLAERATQLVEVLGAKAGGSRDVRKRRKVVARMVVQSPQLLTQDVDEYVLPKLKFLTRLFKGAGAAARPAALVRRFPELLVMLPGTVKANLEGLVTVFDGDKDLAVRLVSARPQLLGLKRANVAGKWTRLVGDLLSEAQLRELRKKPSALAALLTSSHSRLDRLEYVQEQEGGCTLGPSTLVCNFSNADFDAMFEGWTDWAVLKALEREGGDDGYLSPHEAFVLDPDVLGLTDEKEDIGKGGVAENGIGGEIIEEHNARTRTCSRCGGQGHNRRNQACPLFAQGDIVQVDVQGSSVPRRAYKSRPARCSRCGLIGHTKRHPECPKFAEASA